MADQDVNFKVSVDAEKAKQAFKELNNEVSGLKTTAEGTANPFAKLDAALEEYKNKMGKTLDPLKAVKEETEELGKSTLNMGTVFAGAATGGVYLLGNALYSVISAFYESDGAVENLSKKITDLWTETYKATKEWEKFRIEIGRMSLDDLAASIEGVNLQLANLQLKINSSGGNQILAFFGWWRKETDLLTNSLERLKETQAAKDALGSMGTEAGLIERLKLQIKTNTELRDTAQTTGEIAGFQDIINKLEVQLNGLLPQKTKHLKDQKKLHKEILEILRDAKAMQWEDTGVGDATRNLSFGGDATRVIKRGGGAAMAGYSKEYQENLRLVTSLTMTAADTLRSEFSSAWQDIFGEANSLFEKLMMNIAEQLASRAIGGLFSGFLNLIFPGAGTAYGALSGGSSGGGSQQIVINLGDEELSRVVVKGIGQAQRLRIL